MNAKTKHDRNIESLTTKVSELRKEAATIEARKREKADLAADAIMAGTPSDKLEREAVDLNGRAAALLSAIAKTEAKLTEANAARFAALQEAAQLEYEQRFNVLFENMVEGFIGMLKITKSSPEWIKEAQGLEALATTYRLGDRLIGRAKNVRYQVPASDLQAMITTYALTATGNPVWQAARKRLAVK